MNKVIISILILLIAGNSYAQVSKEIKETYNKKIMVGAEKTDRYLSLLKNKNIAVVANHTSRIGKTHLVDSLVSLGVNVKLIFAPEHGFRGTAGTGENSDNTVDKKTGIPIISLYGKHQQPSAKDLLGIDIVVFDIQDVGVRFYTYMSTLHYVMEGCAENKKVLLLLDRPNPNGFYVDGPMLDKKFTSFVGMDAVPIVHGCTLGEIAKMINGEHWLSNNLQCNLTVINCDNYHHKDLYELPIKPSPNLTNMSAVYLYPSLGLFEGTEISVGRGTDKPFQMIGYPGFKDGKISFTPKTIPQMATHPPYENKECRGIDIKLFGENYIRNTKSVYLFWLKEFYDSYPNKKLFFNSMFDQLAGSSVLRNQITNGMDEVTIHKSWEADLKVYKAMRKKYLLYDDFE